jgi:hypothetical protein
MITDPKETPTDIVQRLDLGGWGTGSPHAVVSIDSKNKPTASILSLA